MPSDVCGSAAERMDVSVLNLDALKKDLGLEFEQWCNNPEDDLRALAAERLIRMEIVSLCYLALFCYVSNFECSFLLESSFEFLCQLAL